ncbi:MAG: F0F1 ATP synthase subunit delta [Bacilli bacterium]
MQKEIYTILEIIIALASTVFLSVIIIELVKFISKKTDYNFNYTFNNNEISDQNINIFKEKYETDISNRDLKISILSQKLNEVQETLSDQLLIDDNKQYAMKEIFSLRKNYNNFNENTLSEKSLINLVFEDVLDEYVSNKDKLINRGIYDFDYALKRNEIRCALPYVFILKVLDMYKLEDNIVFKEIFKSFMRYYKTQNAKRILRNRFLSAEEKLQEIDKEINIIEINKGFAEFILYILKEYNYKHLSSIYTNYIKCFNYRYKTGIITIKYANEYIKKQIGKNWNYSNEIYQLKYEIDENILEGFTISFGEIFVDYSYKTLVIKYLDKVKGVAHGKNIRI